MKRSLFLALGLALASSAFALAVQDPAPAPAARPAQEKPKVYDESADGSAQVAAALAKAKFAHKRVLIQWGANWCGWCVKLHDLSRSDKDIAHELLYEYETVHVDIGTWQALKHRDLAAQYQADFKAHGVPYLTVLDEDGKLVTNKDTNELEVKDSDHHDPAKVLAFLKQNQAAPVKAEALLSAALERAAREQKRLFVHFSTPSCYWCRRLEGWMAEAEVAPLFAKDYVDLMIDVERYTGAPEVLKRYSEKQPGWPWIVVLAADGKALVDGYYAPGKNMGFPSEDVEIAHFVSMLEKTRTNLTPAEVQTIKQSLLDTREKVERAQKQAAPASAGH